MLSVGAITSCWWQAVISLFLLSIHQGTAVNRNLGLAAFASPSIPPPPPISMPVWSLASPSSDDVSMNIVTFCTPVSVAPPKLWAVSLYTNTMTRQAFLSSKQGVLQLLTPSQQDLVPILGKRSGYEEGYSKRDECRKVGYEWSVGKNNEWFMEGSNDKDKLTFDLLPECASYVRLKLLSTFEAGDHDVALCEVIGTGIWDDSKRQVVSTTTEPPPALDPSTALYTAQLREEGII